jgi:hypothetical protein
MAYTTGTLTYIAGGPIEGAWKLWEYTTTDTLAQMTAAGYITDATFKGMSLGDFVIVVNQMNPQGYILQVQNLTAGTLSVSGAATLTAPAGVGGSQLAFPRNIIDGGDFTTNPWQRGISFTGIASTLTYTADRFFAVGSAGSSISVSQVTGVTVVPGFTQALQFGRAAANANTAVINLGQVVETLDSIRAQGQTVTLSFWAQAGASWSPANGALNVLLASGTGANQSAASLVAGTWTGYSSLTLTPQQNISPNSSPNSSPNAAVLTAGANIAQQITTSWQRYSFTATVPAPCTQLGVLFNATPVGTAGAADSVQIMGVQLEIGAQATPFEHRDIELELAIAQRYFFNIPEPASGVIVGAGMVAGATSEIIFIPLPVQMRAAPTVAVSAGSFKFNLAGTATAVGTFAAGSTHTPNYISVTGNAAGTAGQGTLLQGGGGAGFIQASADF